MATSIDDIMDKLCNILRDRMPGVQVRWLRHHHTADTEVEISKSIEGKLYTIRESLDQHLFRTTDETRLLSAQAARIVARTVNGLGNAMIEEKERSSLHPPPFEYKSGFDYENTVYDFIGLEEDRYNIPEESKAIKDLVTVSTNPVANTW
jgi:hypothetical protein